jgi:hypothetical protein
MRGLFALAMLLTVAATAAAAQERNCVARVNQQNIIIVAGTVIDGKPRVTWRERMLNWSSRQWNETWGKPVACDSATTIAFLAGMMSVEDTAGYCLVETADETGYLLVPGTANFRGMCRATACDRVNMLRDEAVGVAARLTEIVTGRQVETASDGIAAVAHGSGAMLLSGQTPIVVEALGQTAAGLGTALASPAAVAAAGVTVVAVGGAVYLCSN